MAEELEVTTAICMFHDVDSAEAAVKDLLELGIPQSEIAIVGDARTEISGTTPTSTLQAMRVPEGDMAMLMDGLRDGGTIVAVRTSGEYAERVERIFLDHSADLVDERVLETNALADHVNRFVNPSRSNFDTVERSRLDVDSDALRSEAIDVIDPLNRVD